MLLRTFEQKYGYSTIEFYRRFEEGQLGDDDDIMMWAGLYHLYLTSLPIRQMSMLTGQRFTRSETDVRETGFAVLIQSLGYADAIRFVTQPSSGQGNYLEWQAQAFEDASADELYERARAHWESHQA